MKSFKNTYFLECGITFLIALIFLNISLPLSAQCPEIIWEDKFDGVSLDETKWSFQIGDGCDISADLCGWGNNELQWYQRENAVVENGTLKIIAKREEVQNSNYSSARIRSINKGDWTYGRFEASIKLPIGKGLWPAFWMLSTNETYGGWPQSGEIDIVELIGQEPEVAHGTIHFGNPWPNNRSSGNSFKLETETFNDDFHEFAVEWEASEIRWFIDGLLYSTKRRSDVIPSKWPFDKDFHFLLNLAVGGSWPGNPDGSTIFPQTMEVNYVRVYDGFLPYIEGNREVPHQAQNVQYQIKNASANANYLWSVPDDATIVAGQGTNVLTVNWNESSGIIQVLVTDDCGMNDFSMDVVVAPPFGKEFSFENFDDPARLSLGFFTGTFEDETANPAPNEINASNLVGKYTRNGGEQFDVLVYDIQDLGDASIYLTGEKKFYIDLYSSAPVGTSILLQLENSNLASPSNYPRGRHSRFEVKTTVQNEWERLEFQFLDQPDASTSNRSVNQFIFLFASNTLTNATYHFDNFDAYSTLSTVPTQDIKRFEKPLLKLTPNPVTTRATLQNLSEERITRIQIIDLSGKIVQQESIDLLPNQIEALNLTSLPKGLYLLRAYTENGNQYSQKVFVFSD